MKKVLVNKKLSGTQGGRQVTYTGPVQYKNVRKVIKKNPTLSRLKNIELFEILRRTQKSIKFSTV
jgi:hypothetical protein